jgi:hypothetical protein
MDLLGYICQETGDAGLPYQENAHRAQGRKTSALLLAGLQTSLNKTSRNSNFFAPH